MTRACVSGGDAAADCGADVAQTMAERHAKRHAERGLELERFRPRSAKTHNRRCRERACSRGVSQY